MSPGNIYRFFKGKIDIAVEIARREALSAVEVIEAVLDCPVRSSRQRLEEVVFADLRYTFHLLENRPKTLELAQIVVSDRPQFQIESLRRERRVFQRILHEGQASGEFYIDNVAATTIALHAATTKYRYAQLFTNPDFVGIGARIGACHDGDYARFDAGTKWQADRRDNYSAGRYKCNGQRLLICEALFFYPVGAKKYQTSKKIAENHRFFSAKASAFLKNTI